MGNPTAAMLVIGDEILSGRTKDANLGHLAQQLTNIGVDLKEARVVADVHDQIVDAVRALSRKWDHVFTSGGIGPTHDDITADAIADVFDVGIDVRADALALLRDHYARTGTDLNAARMRMARIPAGGELIDNPVSIAPGFTLENVHVMAGVPAIFQAMVASVLPLMTGGEPLLSRTIRIDLPEGEIATALRNIANRFPNVAIGSYPFILDGRFGSNIVFRSADPDDMGAAIEAMMVLAPTGREL